VITTILNSLPGRVLRFVAGAALALWGFAFAVPEGLVVQTLGVTIAVFAIADISVLRALHIGGRPTTTAVGGNTVREKHA